MERITNKKLAENFGINLAKIRRWAREFLSPDPKATRQSGYTRELTNEEAFDIFLGGHLVNVLGFLVYEARGIIKDLKPLLKSKGLYPDKSLDELLKKINHEYKIRIMRSQEDNGFHYEIREQLEWQVSIKEEDIIEEKYRIEWIGRQDSTPYLNNFKFLEFTMVLSAFIAVIKRGSENLVKVPIPETIAKKQSYFLNQMMSKQKL